VDIYQDGTPWLMVKNSNLILHQVF